MKHLPEVHITTGMVSHIQSSLALWSNNGLVSLDDWIPRCTQIMFTSNVTNYGYVHQIPVA
jgi:hypothetical protein